MYISKREHGLCRQTRASRPDDKFRRFVIGFTKLFLILLFFLFSFVLLKVDSVFAAPPYKAVISGPGIEGKVVIWLANDEDLLLTLNSGLTESELVQPPDGSIPIYKIDWYFGRCWADETPCTEDPSSFVIHSTRYVFDPVQKAGAISHLDTPAWFENPPPTSDSWYKTSDAFDHAVFDILSSNGVGVDNRRSPNSGWLIPIIGLGGAVILSILLLTLERSNKR